MYERYTKPGPTTIRHTKRQSITTRSGLTLERAYVFMPAQSWDSLQRLCVASGRSGSQVLQSLISIAALGNHKDINDDSKTVRTD